VSRRLRALALVGAAVALFSGRASAQHAYVAFGDSITFGFADPPNPAAAYPAQLKSLLAARGLTDTVRNAGLPNETTAGGLTRINSVLNQGGDTLLLMEGTNDINAQNISNETIAFNLDQIAIKAEARGWTVVHAPVIPRLPSANHDGMNTVTGDLAAQTRNLAWQKLRRLADPFEVFITTTDVFTRYYVGGSDKLHPNAAGYLRLAEVFRDVLVGIDTVPPVPGVFSPAHGVTNAPALGPFTATLYDFGQGIDATRTTMLLNGTVVASVAAGDAKKLTMSYTPTAPVHGQITLSVRSSDLNIPPNTSEHVLSTFVTQGTTFLDGDVNRDGRVDGADLVRMGVAFGARKGDPRYFAPADINGDNLIDGLDFSALAFNFGRSSF